MLLLFMLEMSEDNESYINFTIFYKLFMLYMYTYIQIF
jgi:hypothetical protein